MALTDTDLQLVVEHVTRMLPAMLTKAAPDYNNGTQKLISRIEQNLVRVEEHLARSEERSAQEFKALRERLARSEERSAQEFKALRELMQAGFAAVDKRFEDMKAYQRFEDMKQAL